MLELNMMTKKAVAQGHEGTLQSVATLSLFTHVRHGVYAL